MSSGRFAEVRTPLILSILMVLMTQVGYLDLMNAWSGDEETLDQTSNMPDERAASLSSGSSTTNILNGYQLSAKGLHSCSILDNGSLMCWGLNNRGQIGIGTTTNAHTPQWVDLGSGTNVTQVANGYRHTCAMLENGSLMCWGENSNGQLGNGQSYSTQTTPLWVDLGAGRTATRIDASNDNTCAIVDNGSLYCWGTNSNGMLNKNPILLSRQFTPRWIDLGGHTPSSISVGNMNVCTILNNGSLYCWGDDSYGQLARGSVTGSDSWDPLYVDFGTGVTVSEVDVGSQHLCAIVDNGSLYCWGRNIYGQLGNGSGGSSNPSTGTPSWVDLGTGRTAVAVSAGSAITCAIVDNGSLYCWGTNSYGEVGIGTTGGTPYTPQWVDLGVGRTAVAVSTGTTHTCATLDNGSISCWGSDYSGALGNGAGASDSSSPGIISGGFTWSTSNGSNSGGSSSNYALTPSVEGAELLVGQAMSNITFEYDTGAANGTSNGIPSNGTYNGNGTAWKVSTVHTAGLGKVGNTLYFRGNDGTNGWELWKSDGTDSGTEMVKDINSGQGWGMHWTSRFTPVGVGNEVYFAATDGTNGNELWKTDGTASGTVMVKNINDGSVYPYSQDSLNPTTHDVCPEPGRRHCIEMNNEFYFSATNATNGTELWKSDGTASGTVMVKDIATQYSYSSGGPHHMVVFNNTLYFAADDGTNGIELWKSDGTASGTVMVKDINPYYGWGTEDSRPSDFVVMNGTLYFQAHTNSNGRELWKTDGTATGTVMVKDIRSGSSSSVEGNIIQRQMTLFNNTLYFQANDGTNGMELWKSDGTASGTVMVKNIRIGSTGSDSTELAWFTGVGDRLYFWADDGGGHDLWKTDGTASGTVKIKDFTSGEGVISSGNNPDLQAVIGNMFYFVVDDGTTASNPGVYGREVWKTDGTSSGTVRVTDINTGSGNAGDSHPAQFTVIGTTLYFTAWDGGTNSTGQRIHHVWALDPANITGLASSITNVAGATCSISPSLPTGLSINGSTCTISGTPTVASSNTTYTVTAVISGVTYQTTVWLSSLNRQLTPSVEGADLTIDVPMTNITFQYNASAASGSGGGSVTSSLAAQNMAGGR
ncbi:MAG: ELWxxDGT repeat protein, partial [Candidatus Poseidoniales archaeon]